MVRTGTLRERDLVSAGLVEAGRLEEIERVAGKFAVALTTDMAALIDPADPADPIAAGAVPAPKGTGGWIIEDPAGVEHTYPADPED